MITVEFPADKTLKLEHVVMDYNGTVAHEGLLLEGVAGQFNILSRLVSLHILTADTFGLARQQLEGLPCQVKILEPRNQDLAKMEYVRELGMNRTVAIGNGRNDRIMVKDAELGIAIIQREGAALETVLNADIVCTSILDALGLLSDPNRLIATLRT